MKLHYLRDQRGVAMLLELVLVAVVLSFVGLAVYQANSRTNTAAVETTPTSVTVSTESLAVSAAATAEQDAAAEAAISAEAEAAADKVAEAQADAANLGDSSDASF